MDNKIIKRDNYIVVQGWMISDLELKGNELLIYACIYGFSQAEEQVFKGSLQYLANWTNSTKQGVIKCLKSLVEKGYIIKSDKVVNGVKFCEYYVTKFNRVLNNVEQGIKQSLPDGIKQSLPNNIDINKQEDKKEDIKAIIDYLNQKANVKYQARSEKTRKHINARLNEGFSVDDFKKVIDNKCSEWMGTEFEKYLRPETLFGTKFENYLNSKARPEVGANGIRISEDKAHDLDDIFK